MKRFCLIVFLILVLLSVPDGALAEGLSNAAHFAQVGQTVFFTVADRLYALDAAAQQAWLAAEEGVFGHLLSDGENLYSLNMASGALTGWQPGQGGLEAVRTVMLDWDVMRDDQNALITRPIRSMAATPDEVCILVSGEREQAPDLLVYDSRTGQYHLKTIPGAQAVAAYRGGSLLIACYDWMGGTPACEIVVYDPQHDTTRPYEQALEIKPLCMLYQPDEDRLYMDDGEAVYMFDPSGGLKMTAKAEGISLSNGRSAGKLGDNYITQAADQGTATIPLNLSGIQAQVLTIAGVSSISADSNPSFAQAYPDVIVKYRGSGFASVDYAQEIVTNVNAADIYSLPASSFMYRAVVSKGYAARLDDSGVIAQAVEEIDPVFRQALQTPQGQVVAVPMDEPHAPILMGYHPSVWEKAGMGDVPQTVPALLERIRYFADREDLMAEGCLLMPVPELQQLKKQVLQTLLQVFLNARSFEQHAAAFDMPSFLELLTAYEETVPAMAKICENQMPYDDDGEAKDNALLTEWVELLEEERPGGRPRTAYMPLALSDGHAPVIDVDMTVLILNAASPNKDLAIAYLAHYMQSSSQRMRVMYVAHTQTPILSDIYEPDKALYLDLMKELNKRLEAAKPEEKAGIQAGLESAAAALSGLEEHKWSVTQETIAQYKTHIPYMKVYANRRVNFFMSGSKEMISLLNQYSDGAIDKNRFAQQYANMISMVYAEQR